MDKEKRYLLLGPKSGHVGLADIDYRDISSSRSDEQSAADTQRDLETDRRVTPSDLATSLSHSFFRSRNRGVFPVILQSSAWR
jgi:hypothetical protein